MRRPTHPDVVFLDRDGTINEKASDGEYITRPDAIRLLPGVARAIRRLNDAGMLTVVVTNQRGIALHRMTEADLNTIHDELSRQLADAAGAHIDAFFFCPHDEGECGCRKPGVGLFQQAREMFPWIKFDSSIVIGDSLSDVEAGRRLGIATLQLGADVPDLASAAEHVLGDRQDENG